MKKILIVLGIVLTISLLVSSTTAVPMASSEPVLKNIELEEKFQGFLDEIKQCKYSSKNKLFLGSVAGFLFGLVTWIPAVILGIPLSIILSLFAGLIFALTFDIGTGIGITIYGMVIGPLSVLFWPFCLAWLGWYELPI